MFLFILVSILFILLPFLLIFALIKPSKLHIRTKKNPSGRWSWKQFFGFLVATFVVATVLLVAGAQSDSVQESIEEDEAAETTVVEPEQPQPKADEEPVVAPVQPLKEADPKPVKAQAKQSETFGMTVSEFGNAFMAHAKEAGLGDHAWERDPELSKGAVDDSFTVMLRDDLAMNGTVDKNGELKGITYIMGKTDEGDTAAMNMLVLGGLTARVLNPNVSPNKASEAISDLMISAVETFEKTGSATETKTVGDVKYTVVASKSLGLWLAFEPAE